MLFARTDNARARRHAGFTLVELMIVVVIVGILTSIAYPGYLEYTRRAKRAEAKALLSDIAVRQERFYFDHNTYTTDTTELGFPFGDVKSAERHYKATVAAMNANIATGYIITAILDSGSDPKCGNLTLDSSGTKGSSVSANAAECWR